VLFLEAGSLHPLVALSVIFLQQPTPAVIPPDRRSPGAEPYAAFRGDPFLRPPSPGPADPIAGGPAAADPTPAAAAAAPVPPPPARAPPPNVGVP